MASAHATLDLAIPADEIWQLIGGFNSLPDWIPGVTQSPFNDGGRIRHLHTPDGHTFVERLESYNRVARRYSYSIVASPVSVTGYLATIAVTPTSDDSGSHVDWSATFNPAGISTGEAESIFTGIFSYGLKALVARFAESTRA